VEEKTIIEKRTVREEPIDKTMNVNVGPDGTTNVQESGDTVVEEERVEEHEHQP
jgi:hypothetical protein